MDRGTKSLLRTLLFRCGALSARHYQINRNRLTTVMFHRVLSTNDPRWAGADPEYTLSVGLFADALAFLRRHYSIVSLRDLFASLDGHELPRCPLLITIDDGWADSCQFALPILHEFGLPAAIFIAGSAVDRHDAFWQERVYAAWRTKRVTVAQLAVTAATQGFSHRVSSDDNSEVAIRRFISALESVPRCARDPLIKSFVESGTGPPEMLNCEQICALAASGIDIGVHGDSHEPLTTVDAVSELTRARMSLEHCLRETKHPALRALSFPHGRYDAKAIAAGTNCGYDLMFTSDPVLTPLAKGRRLTNRLVGRIDVPASAITDGSGRMSPSRMATWLFPRAARPLGTDSARKPTAVDLRAYTQ